MSFRNPFAPPLPPRAQPPRRRRRPDPEVPIGALRRVAAELERDRAAGLWQQPAPGPAPRRSLWRRLLEWLRRIIRAGGFSPDEQ